MNPTLSSPPGSKRAGSDLRGLRLALAAVAALALGGCGVGASNQPLTLVEQKPTGAAGAAGPAGAIGAAGTTGEAGASSEASTTGAAGTTGVAGSGISSAGATGGDACWTSQLPPEPQAPQPHLAVVDACQLGADAQSWIFPSTWTGTNAIKNDDHDGAIVGRWVTCGAPTIVPAPHVGIEFAGNGRWQLLGDDANGALVPLPVRGYYSVLGNGQLNMMGEDIQGVGAGYHFVTFANGDHDAVRFDDGAMGSSVYARVAPSPANGDENAPSISDGHCSMVGSWNVPGNPNPPVEPASVWSFDGLGHFVIDAPGEALCGPHMQWGTYRLSTDGFQLTSNWNLGVCDWWFQASYPFTFSADCSTLTVTQMIDGCTGGRGYLNGTTTLRRRPQP